MFNFSKKKTLLALLGLGVSIGLTALFILLSPSGKITEISAEGVVFRILSVLSISAGIGSVCCIFFNVAEGLCIAGMISLLSIVKVVFELTSKASPSLTVFIIVLVAIVVAFVFLQKRYKSYNLTINGKSVLSNKEKEEQEKIDVAIKDFIDADAQLKSQIGYIDKSIIIGAQVSGALYQVIKTDESFLFHHVGNILTGAKESKLIKDFSSVRTDVVEKKDFFIKYEDVDRITASIKENGAMLDYGNLKITLKNGKNKKFGFINLFEEKELKAFFNDNVVVTNKTRTASEDTPELKDDDKAKLNALNKFFFVFSNISCLVFGAHAIFDGLIANAILATLCIAFCLVPLILYCLFPKYLTVKDDSRRASSVQTNKINVLAEAIFFPAVFAVIALTRGRDLVYYDTARFAIYSAVLFAVFVVLLLTLTKEYKKEKSSLFVMIIFGLLACPSIVYSVDTAYDFYPEQTTYCEIVDAPTWTDNQGEVTYYLTFDYDDAEIKIEVSESVYETIEVGDEILVAKKSGALGIEKLTIAE